MFIRYRYQRNFLNSLEKMYVRKQIINVSKNAHWFLLQGNKFDVFFIFLSLKTGIPLFLQNFGVFSDINLNYSTMITRKITSIKCCFPVNMPKRLCQNLGPSKKVLKQVITHLFQDFLFLKDSVNGRTEVKQRKSITVQLFTKFRLFNSQYYNSELDNSSSAVLSFQLNLF